MPGRSQPDQGPHRPVALRRRRRQAHLRGCVTETSTALGLAAVIALALLRDDGRGQRVNLVKLQAGPGG
jgi:hypothetical protein